jgi:hypothetical protein
MMGSTIKLQNEYKAIKQGLGRTNQARTQKNENSNVQGLPRRILIRNVVPSPMNQFIDNQTPSISTCNMNPNSAKRNETVLFVSIC